MLEAGMYINQDRRRWVVDKLIGRLGNLDGKCVTLLGIAFKPDTDDVREAPALDLVELLHAEGARVVGYDPAAMENAAEVTSSLEFASDPYSAATGADAL